MTRRIVALLGCIALLAASCGGSDFSTAVSSGCDLERPMEPGTHTGVVTYADSEQRYWVVVPASYDGTNPMPVYLLLPGGAGRAEPALAGWEPQFAGLDALVVAPDRGGTMKDVEMVRALVGQIGSDYCVSESNVYAIAGSSSGVLAGWLMALTPDVVAAFAVGIGNFRPGRAEPSVPVPLHAYTGDADRSVVAGSVGYWAAHNGCDSAPTVTDLGSGITWNHYEGCDARRVLRFRRNGSQGAGP